MIFREILRRSEVFAYVLSSLERLPRKLRCSLTFSECYYVFWSVLTLSCGFSAVQNGFLMFRSIPWCFLMFCFVLWRSEEFLLVISWRERFLSVSRCSAMFLAVLRRFRAFCGVSWILLSLKWLEMVLRCFCTFRGVLSCSETFSCVVSRSKRFLKVLRHSVTSAEFIGVFWFILIPLKGSWRFQTFSDFSGCSETFWSVLIGFEVILKDSWTFKSVILRCRVIWGVSMGSEGTHKVLSHYLTVLFCSETFSWDLSRSERLLYIMSHSMKLWGCYAGTSWVLSSSLILVNVLIGCLTFWGALTWTEALLLVLSGYKIFQKVSEAFSSLSFFSSS